LYPRFCLKLYPSQLSSSMKKPIRFRSSNGKGFLRSSKPPTTSAKTSPMWP